MVDLVGSFFRGVYLPPFLKMSPDPNASDLGIPRFQKGFSTVWLKELDLRIPRLIESV